MKLFITNLSRRIIEWRRSSHYTNGVHNGGISARFAVQRLLLLHRTIGRSHTNSVYL